MFAHWLRIFCKPFSASFQANFHRDCFWNNSRHFFVSKIFSHHYSFITLVHVVNCNELKKSDFKTPMLPLWLIIVLVIVFVFLCVILYSLLVDTTTTTRWIIQIFSLSWRSLEISWNGYKWRLHWSIRGMDILPFQFQMIFLTTNNLIGSKV